MFIDFAELKSRVSIEQVVEMLQLRLSQKGEQLRGACPRCKEGGDRALVVTPEKGLAYCFAEKKGGDTIWLASHILDVSFKEAAIHIAEHFTVDKPVTVPEKSPRGEENVLQPLGHLYPEPCVIRMFTKEEAEAVGIGYCKRGLMKDRIAFPLRLPDGTLVGYIGYDPTDGTLKVPPKGLRI